MSGLKALLILFFEIRITVNHLWGSPPGIGCGNLPDEAPETIPVDETGPRLLIGSELVGTGQTARLHKFPTLQWHMTLLVIYNSILSHVVL